MAAVNVQRVGRGTPERLLHGKRRHPGGLSLAGLRPLVLIGDILSPGGSGGVCWLPSGFCVPGSPGQFDEGPYH